MTDTDCQRSAISRLELTGTAFLFPYLHRGGRALKREVLFPLDIVRVLSRWTLGGHLMVFEDSESDVQNRDGQIFHLWNILSRVGYGSKRGFVSNRLITNRLDLFHGSVGESLLAHPTLSRSHAIRGCSIRSGEKCGPGSRLGLMNAHLDGSVLSWRISAGNDFSQSTSVFPLPFSRRCEIGFSLYHLQGKQVFERKVSITGEVALSWFTQRTVSGSSWPKIRGLHFVGARIQNMTMTIAKSEKVALGDDARSGICPRPLPII